jgi:uncharacterized repeat protein (TIGR01451 family)
MKRIIVVLTAALLMGLGLWGAAATPPAQAHIWQEKVDPWVRETAVAQGETEFLIYLSPQADLSGAAALTSKAAKGEYVYRQLTAVADRTQPAVVARLEEMGLPYRQFWVANMIWVRGDAAAIVALAERADVAHIYANPQVQLAPSSRPDSAQWRQAIAAAAAVEPNISLVNAPNVWEKGVFGQGVVIGGQDTGYDWDHPGLIRQYRGWDGSSADHNYNWHDTVSSGGGDCGADSPEPCDDWGHGTHTMGTMVGNDLDPEDAGWPGGAANAVGMAPGARWIGCRNMNVGVGSPASYAECYQWFIAPTDLNGENPDPSLAPHVIDNSWSCPPSEGCTDPEVLLSVVQNVRAAGIVTVHSAGNSGPGCETISDPAAIYDESFTVAATNNSDEIASFSSRGPVTRDGSNRLKPDISAPGVTIRSTVPGGGYSYSSGTSMAAPHVAGLVALLIADEPGLAGQVDLIEGVIADTAVPLTTTQGCGGDGSKDVPNHVFGWGRIDALAAVQGAPALTHTLSLSKTAVPVQIAPGDRITYTLTVSHYHPLTGAQNVVLSDTLPAGTSLVTATTPFTGSGATVIWPLGTLAASDSRTVSLTVQTALTQTSPVVNAVYGAASAEATAVSGPPVTTFVVRHNAYLPWVMHP